MDKYKMRVCFRGDKQKYGSDFEETFAPVASFNSIRMVLAIATAMNWPVWQLDISGAFLYGEIDRSDVYMQIPDGFYDKDKKMIAEGTLWHEAGRENMVSTGKRFSRKSWIQNVIT